MKRDRSWNRRELLGMSLGVVAGVTVLGCERSAPEADLILTCGEIHTVDAESRRAEAVAIARGMIVAVGSSDEVDRFRGRGTRVIDISGRSVVPGINDSHLHGLSWGLGQPPFTLDLSYPTVASIADIAAAVEKAVAARSPGEWIVGRGWDQPYFAEGRAPTRYDLDAVSPDNPVLLTEFSGHAVWVNSKALREAGVDRSSEPPEGGVIVRDEAGEPTGVLFEAATRLAYSVMPASTPEVRMQGIIAACERMLALGITSFTEPGIDVETLDSYAELARSGELPCRLTALLRAGSSSEGLERLFEAAQQLDDVDPRRLRVAGIKIMADGIPTSNKTAWLNESYEGGGNGALLIAGGDDAARVAELRSMIRTIHDAGLQIGTHATGDRTIDEVVAAYVAAMEDNPRPDPRHYLIHADLVSSETLARMAEHGIGANFNASIKYLIADGQRASLGDERSSYEWPYRTALDSGVMVASSSDAPVTDGNWRQGLATAVLREGMQTGRVSGPEQAISFDEALRSYTWTGAWQDRAEDFKGSIEVGKVADLCVLDATLSRIDLHELPEAEVAMTLVGGEVVFERT